ncbi:MAG: D-glycerate dehydrogenase, partial [Actinobacteria bacterium]|nr:D-glycerate dehydrogenase [Actinomycetota bacterium]
MILVTRRLPDDLLEPLHGLGEVEVWEADEPMPRDRMLAVLGSVRGLLGMLTDRIDEEALAAAPDLRVVSQMAVGLDNVDLDACRRRGIRVGHTPGVLTETVADTTFALMAAIVRRLPEAERMVREGRWGTWSPFEILGADLHGQVLGIVGMGGVGRAVAKRAVGFAMPVVYSTPRPAPGDPGRPVPLDELLATSGLVVLCAPLTPDTEGMIGRAELSMMRGDAYLVNVARGPLVDTMALVEALRDGVIRGAALDVVDPEPLSADHPLLGLDNCLVTPHIGSASVRARRAMAALAIDNLVAGLTGSVMPAEHSPG